MSFPEPSPLEVAVPDLPGIEPGMSPATILDRLAKLREEGKLSGNEYHRARRELLAALGMGE